jgi:hypothetical protein
MANKDKVPETRSTKPNREQRRHPEKIDTPENEPLTRDDQLTGQDVQDPRAKNSGHGTKTADKWNQ